MEISHNVNRVTASSETALAGVAKDFETFLKMLTAQIQNQDPLNPIQADQFASQLASFSMVEQQTLTNKTLAVISATLNSKDLANYSNLVGRTAVHSGEFTFSGAPIVLEFEGELSQLSNRSLVIFDDQEVEVLNLEMPWGQDRVTWDGRDVSSQFVAPGTYHAKIRNEFGVFDPGISVTTSATIEEILFMADQPKLVLSDGGVIDEVAVIKLR